VGPVVKTGSFSTKPPSAVLDRTNNARDLAFDASKFRLTQAHRRT